MKITSIAQVLSICILMILLQACATTENTVNGTEETKVETNKVETPEASVQPVPSSNTEGTNNSTEPKDEHEETKIDTSAFIYAKNVDVTDARNITKHIDLVVHMNEGPTPGLATQHVFIQTYDFLQQDDIIGADSITIGIMQGDFRISQITVDLTKFEAGENLINSVLQASKIDKMNDDVKEYGKVMELW